MNSRSPILKDSHRPSLLCKVDMSVSENLTSGRGGVGGYARKVCAAFPVGFLCPPSPSLDFFGVLGYAPGMRRVCAGCAPDLEHTLKGRHARTKSAPVSKVTERSSRALGYAPNSVRQKTMCQAMRRRTPPFQQTRGRRISGMGHVLSVQREQDVGSRARWQPPTQRELSVAQRQDLCWREKAGGLSPDPAATNGRVPGHDRERRRNPSGRSTLQ